MRSILKFKYFLPVIIIISFSFALIFPGSGENQTIRTILTVSGLLFAVILGFFITDLYSRFEKIRANVATEVSGFGTYYSLVKVLGMSKQNKSWAQNQRELINSYVKKYVTVEWHEYEKTDPEFTSRFQRNRHQ